MNKEKLAGILEEQEQREDFPFKGEELQEVQSIVNSIASTQNKVALLKESIVSDKELLKAKMEQANVGLIWASKGRATLKVNDVTKINRDKVLAVIDEFEHGERTSLEFKDVAVTNSQETFMVKSIKVDDVEDEPPMVNFKDEYFKLREMAKELCVALNFGEYKDELGHEVDGLDAYKTVSDYINMTMAVELYK